MNFLIRGHIKWEAGSCSSRSLIQPIFAGSISLFPYATLSYRKTGLCRPLLPLWSCVSFFMSEFERFWWRLEYKRKGKIQYFLPLLQGFPRALATLPASTLPGEPKTWNPSAWPPFFVSSTRCCQFIGCLLWEVRSIYFSCYKYNEHKESLLFACLGLYTHISVLVRLFDLLLSLFLHRLSTTTILSNVRDAVCSQC